MTIATTTMSSLLSAVKTTLLAYQNTTLEKIHTFQRGCLPPLAIFPALALLPIKETYIYGFSNGYYEVDREILIEIYDLKGTTKTAKDTTVDLVKAVKDIFEDNFTFSDSSYFSSWGYESYGETISVNRGFLFNSYISLVCRSRESFATRELYNTVENNPSIVSLQDKLLSILRENKASEFNTVDTIAESPVYPIPNFPAILVGAGSRSRLQTYPAANVSDILFDVAVLSQLFNKETSLNYNLSIVEGVKNVLQSNHTLDGMCEYGNINSIVYDQEKVPTGFIYSTTINFSCRTREFI